ncbi:MAG: AMP-binding protein, partial [Candidatus Saccharimonadales bacterium]
MDSRGCGIRDVEDYEDVLTKGDPSFPDVNIEGDDLAWLFYTSGTTGRPKGAMLTYRALLSMITTQLIENNPLCQDDRFVYLTALSHGSGLAAFLQMARGACHVFPEKMSFDPEYFYQLVERYKVTVAIMVPTMIEMLLSNPNHRKYDLSSLRTIAYGAAPMYMERIREAISTFGPIFVQTYALGEAPRGCTCLQKADHVIAGNKSERRLGSVGRESFHVQVRTVDESGRLLPAGKEGEVVVRGDLVMKGYWKDSVATAETIKNGWLYTGDIGYFDEDGYLFLTNRKKDVIITGGANVYPREVEEILYQHPAVLEACVFGAPDSKWGERIVAAVVCRKDITVSEEDLISWCRKQLAGYKKPSQLSFVS